VQQWLSVLSDLFVNLAAGWFVVVFIEPQVSGVTSQTVPPLILRLIAGILSLTIAKRFREEAKLT